MKERPKYFLAEDKIDHDGEPFDYIRELHNYLWRFVHVAFSSIGGSLTDYIDPAIEKLEAQLAKSKDLLQQFRNALEQSRKGEDLDLPEEAYELFCAIQNDAIAKSQVCPECDGSGKIKSLEWNYLTCIPCQGTGKAPKHRLDRPELREIRMFLLNMSHHCPSLDWQEGAKKYLVKLDKLIALFPDEARITFPDSETAIKWLKQNEEEIRKQERERITKYITAKYLNDGVGVSKNYSKTARYAVAKDLVLHLALLEMGKP